MPKEEHEFLDKLLDEALPKSQAEMEDTIMDRANVVAAMKCLMVGSAIAGAYGNAHAKKLLQDAVWQLAGAHRATMLHPPSRTVQE